MNVGKETVIHVLSEVIVISGVAIHFHRKTNKLQERIDKLEHVILSQEDEIKGLRQKLSQMDMNLRGTFNDIYQRLDKKTVRFDEKNIQPRQPRQTIQTTKSIKNPVLPLKSVKPSIAVINTQDTQDTENTQDTQDSQGFNDSDKNTDNEDSVSETESQLDREIIQELQELKAL